MLESARNPWLHRFAVIVALATIALIGLGGLVTSHGAGLSVPDWPNSYGYNMFLFPPSKWLGGILYEHTHRLLASTVGLLVVALTRWLGGSPARRPLAIVGALEMLAGLLVFLVWPSEKATGGFFTGIGGVVLLAALVWARNEAAPSPLPQLGWLAFVLVQVQGLLGGLRVVLLDAQIGIFHATLAQLFFLLLCAIALMTSRWWWESAPAPAAADGDLPSRKPSVEMESLECANALGSAQDALHSSPDGRAPRSSVVAEASIPKASRILFAAITGLILLQLIIGATMRHQHAGLAIPDFPRAYGRLWPATDPASIAKYNENRMELNAPNPITALGVQLQMMHRVMALLICIGIAIAAWRVSKAKRLGTFRDARIIGRLVYVWLALVFVQIALGAFTIWTDKAADVATAHVLGGTLLLAVGGLLCLISFRHPESARTAPALSGSTAGAPTGNALAAKAAPAS